MDKLNYKNVFPKTPEIVINRIEEEVNKQLCVRRRKLSVKKILIVSMAAVMLLGTTVFAAEKIINIFVEKNGYETKLTIEVPSVSEAEVVENQIEEFAEFKNIAIKLGYVPEGFSAGVGNVKYHSEDKTQGISLMPGKLTDADRTVIINSSIQADEVTFTDRTGYIVTKSSLGNYDKECYVFFEDSSYFVMFYATTGISREEIVKVMENCSIEGTNEDVLVDGYVIAKDAEYMTQWYCDKAPVHNVAAPDSDMAAAFEQFAGVGESILTGNAGVNLTLNKVEVLESIYDLDGFDETRVRKVEGKAFDGDGKILPYTMNLVKLGDGVNTVHTIIDEKEVERTLVAVYLTVSCSGNSYDGRGYNFAPKLIFDEKPAEDIEKRDKEDNVWGGEDLIYNSHCTNNTDLIFYGNMERGEVVDCVLVYAVDTENLAHMGLGLRFSGSDSYVGKAFDIRIK